MKLVSDEGFSKSIEIKKIYQSQIEETQRKLDSNRSKRNSLSKKFKFVRKYISLIQEDYILELKKDNLVDEMLEKLDELE